jgi:hypothetical protein
MNKFQAALDLLLLYKLDPTQINVDKKFLKESLKEAKETLLELINGVEDE